MIYAEIGSSIFTIIACSSLAFSSGKASLANIPEFGYRQIFQPFACPIWWVKLGM